MMQAAEDWNQMFGELVKLEAARLASIPFTDRTLGSQATMLRCVEKIIDVKLLSDHPEKERLPARIVLNVLGIGRWESDISLFIAAKKVS